ncbi:MAG: HPr family phosphocarrier protein [Thermodesulfobacteriota bacterium]
MEVRNFVIKNKLGLHARAAALLVQRANQFACDIKIEKDGLEVNAKSIMGVMMLAAAKDSRVTVKVEGAGYQEALEALGELFEDKFGEE